MVLPSRTPGVGAIKCFHTLPITMKQRFITFDRSQLLGFAYVFRKIQHAKIPPVTFIEDGHLWGLGGGLSTCLSTQTLIFCFWTIGVAYGKLRKQSSRNTMYISLTMVDAAKISALGGRILRLNWTCR